MTCAGGAGGAQLQYMKGSDRTTGATYTEVKNSDEQLVKMFRDKLAQRGARGMLGLQRVFKVMDDNGSGTLDI
jgi:hypothetical protein